MIYVQEKHQPQSPKKGEGKKNKQRDLENLS